MIQSRYLNSCKCRQRLFHNVSRSIYSKSSSLSSRQLFQSSNEKAIKVANANAINYSFTSKSYPVQDYLSNCNYHSYEQRRYISSTKPLQRVYNDIQFNEKVTERLLQSQIGTLNQASNLELVTALSSWHSHATSNPNDLSTFDKVDALFHRLIDEFVHYAITATAPTKKNTDIATSNDTAIKIDIETINTVLDCWRIINNAKVQQSSYGGNTLKSYKLNHEVFIHKGKEILNKCSQIALEYPKNESIQHPNDKSYNIVLDGYSKLGLTQNATEIYDQMNIVTQKFNQHQCRPNTITYNTLLGTYANSDRNQVENAQKAHEILNQMLDIYQETNDPDIKPDLITFSTVIDTYANASSLSNDAPIQAEHLFKTMIEMYNSTLFENGGDGEWIGLKPNHVCFTSLITAWGNSNAADAADRAASVLGFMQNTASSVGGDGDGVDTTMENMTALISAYSKVGGDDDTKKAEELMDNMFKIAETTGDKDMMPTSVTVTALIDCLAQSANRKINGDNGDAASRAETIIKRMEDLYQNGNDRLRPNTTVYNALINAWAKSMSLDAGRKAEEWLNRLEEMNNSGDDAVEPDAITYSSTISAYANIGNGKDAERILMRMYDAFRSGQHCKPNTFSFSTTINAYANQGKPDEAERVLGLMNELPGLDEVKADSFCMNCVLKSYLNSDQKGGINKALALLDEMDEMGLSDSVAYSAIIEKLSKVGQSWAEKKGEYLLRRMWKQYDKGFVQAKPTKFVYASLINLFAKSRYPEVSRKAIDLLNEQLQRYDETKDHDIRPNTIGFNAALSSFAKAARKDDVQKAEQLLEKMEDLYNKGFTDVKPDAFSLTNIISCWANSNVDGAAERAEEILQHMQSMYENGDESMRPTTVAFGAVLNAWAKAGNAERAQAIVDHMEQLQDTEGNEEMVTNTVIYNTLINSWAKSDSPDKVERAESILKTMLESYAKGRKESKPSRITYNSVLAAYQRSSLDDAYMKANDILIGMEASTDASVHPDVVTYSTFLNIIAKWDNPDKIDVAEQVLHRMKKKHKPNNFAYDAVLRACANTNNQDNQTKRKALILTLKTVGTMQESHDIVPTSYSYSLIFTIVCKISSGNEKRKLLERLIKDCCDAGLLTNSIVGQLKNFAPDSIRTTLRYTQSLDQLSVSKLPMEWSKNSNRKLRGADQRHIERTHHDTGRKRIPRMTR